MEKRNNSRNDSGVMFHDDTEKKRDDRHYYRNLVLRSVASFLIGAILSAFFKMLGLGGLIFGILLCLLSGYLAKSF